MLGSLGPQPPATVDGCAEERVQTIGHIQSHGVLFALSEPDLIVRYVSANVTGLLGIAPDVVLGRHFELITGDAPVAKFNSFLEGDARAATTFRVTVGIALEMDCFLHRQDGMLIVEFELLAGSHSLEPLDLTAHVQAPLLLMQRTLDIVELADVVVREVRRLTEFDRVMVYRFDADWNGEVIAEASRPSPTSYLGLRFPAGDIPAPVRALFLINPLRGIADIDAAAVPIVAQSGLHAAKPLDLTRSSLRSAAPVHLEYLRNMGVQASLTISIIVEHRLWGMVTAHHATPRRIHSSTRVICELIGNLFNSQLALRIDNSALQLRLASRDRLKDYMGRVEDTASLEAAEEFGSPGLLDVFDADGLVSRLDGVVSYRGITVDEALLLPVIGALREFAVRGIASSNFLAVLDPDAARYASGVSGALFIDLHEGTGDYLLIVRRELIERVQWAGDPVKATVGDEQGRLHPRASFAAWQETVHGHSRPWSDLDVESAAFLREQLLRLHEAQQLHKSEERARYLANHDALTGLYNRYSLNTLLDDIVKQASEDHSAFVVLFIDLDRFKHFNDRLGHAAGDKILKIVAKRIQFQVRDGDVVGRLGGDEFIVVLLGLRTEDDLVQAVGRILTGIEEPLEIDRDIRINITASIGISRYPADGTTSDMLVNRSDMAMYRVKRSGGNAFALTRSGDLGPDGDQRAAP